LRSWLQNKNEIGSEQAFSTATGMTVSRMAEYGDRQTLISQRSK